MKSLDYTDFKEKDSKANQDDKAKAKKSSAIMTPINRWWLADDQHMPAAIMSQCAAIIKADRGRIDGYNTFARLYGTWTPTFWNGYQLTNSGRPTAPLRDRLTYNIVQSCVDTITSSVTQNKPKPMFLTSDGDSKVQRRAKKLDQFCYGLYYENDVYALGPKIFRDGCIFGEGILHAYAQNGVIKFERVLPYEILVDYLESHYGPESTQSLHRIKNIDRTILVEWVAQKDKALAANIAKMAGTAQFIATSNQSVGDTVTVVESWRLPPSPDKPGLHTLTAGDFILTREEYTDNFFPFAVFRFCPRVYGWFSQGLAEQLIPTQTELNRTLISIQRSLYLGGTHKIFVKSGSKIIKSHFDNLIGTIMEYAGDRAPEYVVPQLVQPEVYAHLAEIKASGYELPGVSRMQATSQKSPGVNSGRAMRTEQNINTQRHQTIEQGYNQFLAIDLARIVVSAARKEYAKGKGNSVKTKVPGKRFIQKIEWKDVDLPDDEFVLQIYPVSKLPNEPEGRLAAIQEMMESGLCTPEEGRRLLDYPDLDAEEGLANAMMDYLHKILDDIVDEGKYTGPEPEDNLVLAKKYCLEYLVRGKLNNLSKKRITMLRKFNQQINDLVNAANPPQAAAPTTAAPMAAPEPTPTNNMIPNVAGAPGGQSSA